MWAAEHFYEILGTRFRVASEDPEPARALELLLANFRVAGRGARTANTFCLVGGKEEDEKGLGRDLYRDASRLMGEETWGPLVNRVLQEINRRAVGGYGQFAAHAGVVGMADRTVALVAGSGGGKSTLTAACLLAGFDYGSDEALCLRYEDATVEPYPKPLGLSEWSRKTLAIAGVDGFDDEAPVTADMLGAGTLSERRDLTDVVLLRTVEEASPQLEQLPRSRAVAELLEHSFNHFKNPAGAFKLVDRVARNVNVWTLTYSSPLAGAGHLRAWIESH